MNYTVGQTVHGFQVTKRSEVRELSASLVEMEHIKSGAKLVYVDCDDENKVFGISFKTVPEDSTGVFHILEHCMLNGSEKYPLREPFVNLLKNSLQTFLNAMTFPDKTVYPVASRNEKDFSNLMSVYLDAVFAPNLRTNKNVFLQEGWHYELTDDKSEPVFKGVVFNEMKGAMSSVFDVLEQGFLAALYPDTCYRHNSGGDPRKIPDLTYEQFLSSYHKHYHADNASIFLYGKMDVEAKLAFMDEEYLSKFERNGETIVIERQSPVVNTDAVATYAIGPEDEEEGNAYCQLGWCVAECDDREKLLAYEILNAVLFSTNESPLKKAIMDAGLGKDVRAEVLGDVLQPAYFIQLHKTNADEGKRFEFVVRETLKKIADEGIDQKALEAAINNMEFKLREMETGGFPQGVMYGLYVASAMNYGIDPATHIRYEKELASLRAGMQNGYFERLIYDLLESKHYALLTVKPSKTLGAEQAEEEARKCREYRASLNEEQVQSLIRLNQELRVFQETEDTPEQIATLPTLTLADLDREPTIAPTEHIVKENREVLFHEVKTGGIVYLTLYYNLASVAEDDLPKLATYASLLGKIKTKKHTAEELNTEVMLHLGGLSFGTVVYGVNAKEARPMLKASVSYLEGDEEKAISLLREVLDETVCEAEEVDKLIAQKSAMTQMRIMQRGNAVAYGMVSARLTAAGAYAERMEGVSFYRALQQMKGAEFEGFSVPFKKNNLIVSVTGSKAAKENLLSRISCFETGETSMQKSTISLQEGNPAVTIPAGINYVAKGGASFKGTYKPGNVKVMKQILSLDYLWNEVRAKGGAYGVGVVADKDLFCFVSYRDPNVVNTLGAYDNAEAYLKNVALTDDALVGYIIGTVAGEEPTLSPKLRGAQGDADYFKEISEEEQRKTREELLSTTEEDLKNMANLIAEVKEQGFVAAVGNAEKLAECKAFTKMETL
ncbi:MAG: insulinase family protein [Clostridia bacterium]|nr:insulinase family protein [Clostridia bacterium]